MSALVSLSPQRRQAIFKCVRQSSVMKQERNDPEQHIVMEEESNRPWQGLTEDPELSAHTMSSSGGWGGIISDTEWFHIPRARCRVWRPVETIPQDVPYQGMHQPPEAGLGPQH
jgi:hypothetical protein